ncbi:MAG: phosphopantetheine-binding protein [Syntrophales bacterium]|nr:phosphopantetheine-binding protein [Syntrophales bacterium]
MDELFKKIGDGLRELYPEMGKLPISMKTHLGDIPGYDSMAAVNLQSFIDEAFHISIPLDLLNEDTTLGDLVSFIQDPQKIKAAT